MNQHEHALQKRLLVLCREHIAEPHKFIAYDRKKGSGRFTLIRENARGLITGHADVRIARKVGLRDPYIEIKVLPNKFDPKGDQAQFGAEMVALGHYFGVAYNAAEFVAHLRACGVVVRNTIDWAAAIIDAKPPAVVKKKAPAKPRVERRTMTAGDRRRQSLRYGLGE